MGWSIEPLATGSDRWLNLYNENIKCILYNSEIFAGIVNYVGTKMDLRLAVRIAYVELQSLSKA